MNRHLGEYIRDPEKDVLERLAYAHFVGAAEEVAPGFIDKLTEAQAELLLNDSFADRRSPWESDS